MTGSPAPLPAPHLLAHSRRDALVACLAWLALLALVLVTAGAVDPAAGAALSAFFLLRALTGSVASWAEVPRAARWAIGAALLACAIQLLPLPESVRAVLAPGPTSARADLHRLGLQGAWAPISVDVGATVYEAVLWAGAAAALVVFRRGSGAPPGARLVVGLLVALHGLAWLDSLWGVRVFPLTYVEDPWGVGQESIRKSDFAGWLVNRSHWAALGLVLWPLAAHWAWTSRGLARRVLGSLAAAAVIASLVATKSRAGLGVVGLQAFAFATFLAWRAPKRVRIAGFAAIAVGAVLAAGPIRAYLDRISLADIGGRRDIYVATARMALDSPAVGWGMGSFQTAFPAYQPDALLYKYSHAHCDPLEWVAGAGAFGLALVAGLAWLLVSGARDRSAAPLARVLWTLSVAGGAAAACVEFPLHIPAVRFLWLGVLFVGPPRPRPGC